MAGDLRQTEKLKKLSNLAKSRSTAFLQKFSFSVESFLIHATPRDLIDFFDIPEMFRLFDETFEWDYGRIFSDHEKSTTITEVNYISGSESIRGATDFVILCRPDQHVAWIGGFDELNEMERMFSTIFNM